MAHDPKSLAATHPLHRDAPGIACLLVVGGPSGSGKTTFADAAIASGEAFGAPLPQPILRSDSRSFRQKDFSGGTFIIEYATNAHVKSHAVALMHDEIDHLIARADRALVVSFEITKWEVVRRYIGRMAHEDLRRTPEILRYLRLRKWWKVVRYMLSNDVERGNQVWRSMVARFAQREGVSTHSRTP